MDHGEGTRPGRCTVAGGDVGLARRLPFELHEMALRIQASGVHLFASDRDWRQIRHVIQIDESNEVVVFVSVLSKHEFTDSDVLAEAVETLVLTLDDEEVAS